MLTTTHTTTALAANGVFTGTTLVLNSNMGYQGGGGQLFSAYFYSDKASATNGAQIQGSVDNTNWFPLAQGTLAAATPLILQVPPIMPYMRLVLTNGATAQTTLMARSGVY